MKKWNYLCSLGLVSLGIYLLSIGFQDYKEGIASVNWPKVEGVITYSAAEDGSDSSSFSRIKYSYKVNEMLFEGDRVYAESLETAMSRKNAENLAMKYPVGRRGRVSYDPTNPQKSVLMPGVTVNIWLPFWGGIVFVIFGFIHFLGIYKSVSSERYRKLE